jgi:hypothetical protein
MSFLMLDSPWRIVPVGLVESRVDLASGPSAEELDPVDPVGRVGAIGEQTG